MDPVFAFKPLTVDDVAAVLGVSVRTVENHIEEQGLPRPVKIGKIRYWHPDVFYGWLDRVLRGEARAEPSAQPAPINWSKAAERDTLRRGTARHTRSCSHDSRRAALHSRCHSP